MDLVYVCVVFSHSLKLNAFIIDHKNICKSSSAQADAWFKYLLRFTSNYIHALLKKSTDFGLEQVQIVP